MAYIFVWDPVKAVANVRDHRVTFDEASTAFGDPLALLMPDPDHSEGEERYLLLGMSTQERLLVVAFTERPPTNAAHLGKAGHPTRTEAI